MIATYLLSGAFLITSTVLRFIRIEENHSSFKRFMLAFRFRDPRRKSLDVGMMLIQYTSIMMFLLAPVISRLERTYQGKSAIDELLQILIAFMFPISLLIIIKFFDLFYWSKKGDE